MSNFDPWLCNHDQQLNAYLQKQDREQERADFYEEEYKESLSYLEDDYSEEVSKYISEWHSDLEEMMQDTLASFSFDVDEIGDFYKNLPVEAQEKLKPLFELADSMLEHEDFHEIVNNVTTNRWED